MDKSSDNINLVSNYLLSKVTLKDFKFDSEPILIESDEYKELFKRQRWKIEKCPGCGAMISEIEQKACENCGKQL